MGEQQDQSPLTRTISTTEMLVKEVTALKQRVHELEGLLNDCLIVLQHIHMGDHEDLIELIDKIDAATETEAERAWYGE